MRSTRATSRSAYALALAFAPALALAGCREPYPGPRYEGAGASAPQRGGVLRWAIDADLRSLDPHVAFDELSTASVRIVFDTLVDYEPGTTRLVPVLAERFEVSDDRRAYTFVLRPGVRFHSGRVLTARDVVRSFTRMLDPRAVPCPGASFYLAIEGAEALQARRTRTLAGVEALDERTVRFRLREPDPTFLNVLAMPFAAPIDVDAAEALGNDGFAQRPVGAGPFRVERWETGSRVVLRRHEGYWRAGRPYLDGVVLETGLARHLQFLRFQRGELEVLHTSSLGTSDYLWLKRNPAWSPYVLEQPDVSVYGLAMNTELAPFDNVHLRRAIAFGVDRDAMVRSRHGRIRAARGLYPEGLPGFDPSLPTAQRYDPEEARRELALAGYAGGVPGEHALWVTEGDAGAQYGQLVQADLARLGVRVRLRQASFAVFLTTTQRRGAAALSLSAWSQDYPDPQNFIETLFHSRNAVDEGSQNVSFYRDPELDRRLDAARREADPSARLERYREAERLLVARAPWAFLYSRVLSEVRQPYLRGYRLNPVFQHDYREAWLDLPRRRAARLGARLFPTRRAYGALGALLGVLGARTEGAP